MFKFYCVFLFLLISPSSSFAALISHYGYTLDTETNIISNGKLEWLRWDQNKNISWDTSKNSSLYSSWDIANNSQVKGLFDDFFSNPYREWDADPATEQRFRLPYEETYNDRQNAFLDLFGFNEKDDVLYDPDSKLNVWRQITVIYGEDHDDDYLVNTATVSNAVIQYDYGRNNYIGGYINLHRDWHTIFGIHENHSVALVRAAIQVNEPAVAALFLFFVVLVIQRVRHKKFLHE